MKMRFLVLICVCLIFYDGVWGKSVRIVGGENSIINEFPYLVSLRIAADNLHFCAGSIISESHVLTAAHCLYNVRYFQIIRIYAGANNAVETTMLVYTIDYVTVHPAFTGTKSVQEMNHHDIAVVKLNEHIEFNEFQNKIDLPTSQYVGETGIIVGWGQNAYPAAGFSEMLQKASLNIYSNAQCQGALPFLFYDEQFCACSTIGIGACIGDSGGPIVSDGKIIGIISVSIPCGLGIPDVFTRVHSYHTFINSALEL